MINGSGGSRSSGRSSVSSGSSSIIISGSGLFLIYYMFQFRQ
jgi:hypothetical protein